MIKKICCLFLIFLLIFTLTSCRFDESSKINPNLINGECKFNDYESFFEFITEDIIIYNETYGYSPYTLKLTFSRINSESLNDFYYYFYYQYSSISKDVFIIDDKLCINLEEYYNNGYSNIYEYFECGAKFTNDNINYNIIFTIHIKSNAIYHDGVFIHTNLKNPVYSFEKYYDKYGVNLINDIITINVGKGLLNYEYN